MKTDCKDCVYGDVATGTRRLRSSLGNIVITQVCGGVLCTKQKVRNITITDGEKVCSDFVRREQGCNC